MPNIGQEAKLILTTAFVNMSVAQNKEKMFDDTLVSCSRALELDPQNTKAMFLRGTAFMHTGRFNEAMRDAEMAV